MEHPQLDPQSPQPLIDQLAEHYRSAIEQGRLRAGDRLPTIRAVAAALGVTRNTVQGAYQRLQSFGLVEATVGRGTVVRSASMPGVAALSPGARAAHEHLLALPQPATIQPPVVCDFAELKPDANLFPVEGFTASLQRVLDRRGPELLGYGQPTGDRELRRLLATRADGADDPDAVLITNGAQQGIDLVLRTFTRDGDGVAVAMPTYHHLFGLLDSHDLRVVPLRSDASGLDLEALERVVQSGEVRLLYLMPTFQNPTGNTLDLAQREALMRIVARTSVPVLEDEFELELRIRGATLPSLRSLDPRGLTVTVRTFSKGLFPGVRLGWLHAGAEMIGPMAALKRYMDLETSPLLQAALVDFLQSGALEAHNAELCEVMRGRHAIAQDALQAHMPAGFTWTKPDGGLALWVEGPKGFDAERLARTVARHGVGIAPGRLFHRGSGPFAGFRLSLSRAEDDAIAKGIEILAECAGELTAVHRPSRSPLIL